MELQHDRVHLAFQTVTEEQLFLYKTIQDIQFTAIVVTHFFLAVSSDIEIGANQEKNDYECNYMSNVSAHNKCMTTFGQKAKFRTFCRLSAAKLRLIFEKAQ